MRHHARVYFDTGAIIEFDCDSVTAKKAPDSSFSSLEWIHGSLSLFTLDLRHVVAITTSEIEPK